MVTKKVKRTSKKASGDVKVVKVSKNDSNKKTSGKSANFAKVSVSGKHTHNKEILSPVINDKVSSKPVIKSVKSNSKKQLPGEVKIEKSSKVFASKNKSSKRSPFKKQLPGEVKIEKSSKVVNNKKMTSQQVHRAPFKDDFLNEHAKVVHINENKSINKTKSKTGKPFSKKPEHGKKPIAVTDKTFLITPSALERIKHFQGIESKKGKKVTMLRLFVYTGGCKGLQYHLEMTDTINDGDIVVSSGDRKMAIMDPQTLDLLNGGTLDYVDSISGSYFRIQNPNAGEHCHCGNSFCA